MDQATTAVQFLLHSLGLNQNKVSKGQKSKKAQLYLILHLYQKLSCLKSGVSYSSTVSWPINQK